MQGWPTLLRVLFVFTTLTATFSNAIAQDTRGGQAGSKAGFKQSAARNRVATSPLSDQDCRTYAQSVTKAVASGDQAALNALIDWDQFFSTVMAGMEMTEKLRKDVALGLHSEKNKDALTGQFIKNSQAGGNFDYLRARQSRGRQSILFRMIQPAGSGGVGYFEFIPQRSADGKIRAVDIYVFSSGEFLATTLRNALLPIVANESRSFLDKLIAGERDYVTDFPQLVTMSTLINQGKMKEALAIVKGLKPETKKQKVVLLNRLRAAQRTDENEYSAVLDDFRKFYSQDPCLELLLIDYYTLKKNYARLNQSIDRLDKSVGGDPYLNVMRVGVKTIEGDYKEARAAAYRGIKEEPTLIQAYYALLGVSIQDKNYKETLDTLEKLDQTFHVKMNDLSTVPEYAGFVKSPQYQEWLRYLSKKNTARQPKKPASPAKVGKNRVPPEKPGSRD
jgi:hypothetical protein